MCLAVPARVTKLLQEGRAVVDQDGHSRTVNVMAVPEVAEGDYVLLNLGVAVQRLSEEEAGEVMALWQDIEEVLP